MTREGRAAEVRAVTSSCVLINFYREEELSAARDFPSFSDLLCFLQSVTGLCSFCADNCSRTDNHNQSPDCPFPHESDGSFCSLSSVLRAPMLNILYEGCSCVICVDIWWYWNWILVILKYSEIWSGLGKCHGCQGPDSLDGIRIFMRPSWINCVQLCCVGPGRDDTWHLPFFSHINLIQRKISLGKLKSKTIFVLAPVSALAVV